MEALDRPQRFVRLIVADACAHDRRYHRELDDLNPPVKQLEKVDVLSRSSHGLKVIGLHEEEAVVSNDTDN